MTAKIVAMNNRGPSVCDDDGYLRSDITDIANIIGNLDEANGRNDALRCYILALRDLQRAHDGTPLLGTTPRLTPHRPLSLQPFVA